MGRWILCLACLLCFEVCLEAQYSVQFEKDSWEAAKEKAQIENKLIFIDGITTWCAPCKMMDIQVFNRSSVAHFFNRNFVNFKMDMEKGPGPILALNYGLREFPAFLFITPDGTLVHKFDGYKHADQMLAYSKTALDPHVRRTALDTRYNEGGRKPDFLYNYTFERLERMDDSHKEIVQEFLKAEKDWGTKKNIQYIFQFMESIDSEMFTYMASNRAQFEEVVGKEEVSRTIDIMVNNKIFNSSPAPSIEEVADLYQLAYPEKGKKLASEYKLKAFKDAGDFDKYADVAIEYYTENPFEDDQAFSNLIKEFYAKASQPQHISTAYLWAKKLSSKSSSIEDLYQVALFEFKLKDKKRAKKTIKTALKMAKKSKYSRKSELDSLSKKIKKM